MFEFTEPQRDSGYANLVLVVAHDIANVGGGFRVP